MNNPTSIQCCAVCAWRRDCQKKFSVFDDGARCPDFTRDLSLAPVDPDTPTQ